MDFFLKFHEYKIQSINLIKISAGPDNFYVHAKTAHRERNPNEEPMMSGEW